MFRLIVKAVFGAAVLLATISFADTLTLKDGRVLSGTYLGGSSSELEFKTGGSSNTYHLATVVSVKFESSDPGPANSNAHDNQPPPPPPPKTVTINPGTTLMVKIQTALRTGKVSSGDRFSANLVADLISGNRLVAPQGSTVYGRVTEAKKAGRIMGVAKLVIELTGIMVNGQLYPVVTETIGYKGHKSGTLKKIALGAAAGGVIDGSEGAGKGAAVGAGVAVLTKGKQIEIAAGSLVQFRTTQPLKIGP